MNSKYKTLKYKKNKILNVQDLVSIEEPLEMVVRYKSANKWVDNSISITMRTPKNDEDLIVGLLFCEGIIQKISEVEKVEFLGKKEIELYGKTYEALHFKFLSSDETLPDNKKLNTDIWYDSKSLIWLKAQFVKQGNWEYRLKKHN